MTSRHSCAGLHTSTASKVYSTSPRHCYSWMTLKTSHSCTGLHTSTASTVYSTCPRYCYSWMTLKTSHSCTGLHTSTSSTVYSTCPRHCYSWMTFKASHYGQHVTPHTTAVAIYIQVSQAQSIPRVQGIATTG